MKQGQFIAAFIALALVAMVASGSFFVVNEIQQVIVTKFGKHQRTIQEPGLHFKLPFFEEVILYDRRILSFDTPAQEYTLQDQKRVELDTFVRYQITDPLLFFQTLRSEQGAVRQLGQITITKTREQLGRTNLNDLIHARRAEVMTNITKAVNEEAKDFGVAIRQVRIRRADLPQSASDAVFSRMRTQREAEAKDIRATGEAEAGKIRAEADRKRVVTLADAERQAQILRGQGDAEASKIFADAFQRDAEFYRFYRTMQAYRSSLASGDTTIVLSPDNPFLKLLQGSAAPTP